MDHCGKRKRKVLWIDGDMLVKLDIYNVYMCVYVWMYGSSGRRCVMGLWEMPFIETAVCYSPWEISIIGIAVRYSSWEMSIIESAVRERIPQMKSTMQVGYIPTRNSYR